MADRINRISLVKSTAGARKKIPGKDFLGEKQLTAKYGLRKMLNSFGWERRGDKKKGRREEEERKKRGRREEEENVHK